MMQCDHSIFGQQRVAFLIQIHVFLVGIDTCKYILLHQVLLIKIKPSFDLSSIQVMDLSQTGVSIRLFREGVELDGSRITSMPIYEFIIFVIATTNS